MRFVRSQLGCEAVPRTASGMPLDMAERGWAVDRYLPALGLEDSAQTGRHTGRPFIAFGRAYPGVQLKNGVAQLDPHYEVPPIPGTSAPYWQQTVRVNPPTYLHGGGSPYPPQGPYQVAQMLQSAGSSNVADIGPSYFTPGS